MRYSKQREAVYRVLCATNTHPDVSYIHKETLKIMPAISLGTVYRNLDELCNCGRIKSVSVEGSSKRFDATTTPHAHFVCTHCGSVQDVLPPAVDLRCECGQVERAEVILYGVCEKCQNNLR